MLYETKFYRLNVTGRQPGASEERHFYELSEEWSNDSMKYHELNERRLHAKEEAIEINHTTEVRRNELFLLHTVGSINNAMENGGAEIKRGHR